MKIAIVGLGLIGASMAGALKKYSAHTVGGKNRNPDVLKFALDNNIIDEVAENICDYDVVFVALPPEVAIEYITSTKFKKGAIVADICGVKQVVENAVNEKERDFRYVGCHPMAGKEVASIYNSTPDLFSRASMIITTNDRTDSDAVETIKALTKDMNFAKIVVCSAKYHDEKIAYTSQLAHIVSNAYVKSPTMCGYHGFTGGSFQDMTRIAAVDENVWTQLYSMNSPALSVELDTLIDNLCKYRDALKNADYESMRKILREGRETKEERQKVVSVPEVEIISLK